MTRPTEVERTTEHGTDLWRVVLAPVIWAAHFLVCYIGAAIWCAKLGRDAGLDPVRWGIAAVTLAAALAIGLLFRSLWKVGGLSVTGDDLIYEHDTPEERHRFLSHIAMMMCVLSLAGILYVSIPAMLVETCR